jgi:hypothetical protein
MIRGSLFVHEIDAMNGNGIDAKVAPVRSQDRLCLSL